MEYHAAINRLERLRRLQPEMGTETTASLLSHLGDPHDELVAVQIAGSNGKGSTARILDRILREAGLTVGCYTSPDLNDRRERITVQGQKIPKNAVVTFVERIWPYIVEQSVEGTPPTFFEVFTAMSLWYFGREDVDVAVLEVGIGGRYDATSVVDPVAGAVTSVSLEHTDLLGSTVREIARDKAHVAPTSAPLVTGTTGPALDAIREETAVVLVGPDDVTSESNGRADTHEQPTAVVRATEIATDSPTRSSLSLVGPDWDVRTETPLLGQHQAVNAGIATVLAKQVADPSTDAIERGIRNVRWPGRFEVMSETPLTILDGAHNPEACATIATLLDRFDYDDLHLVFGALCDKDHLEMSRSLPEPTQVFLAPPDVDRAQEIDTLTATFDRETEAGISQYESVLVALDRALATADPADCVLVTGSLSTVSEARDRWTRTIRSTTTATRAQARKTMTRADVSVTTQREQADQLTHRTVRCHVRQNEATEITGILSSLGGSYAVSDIDTPGTHVELVLSGTIAQFKALTTRLRGRSIGGRHLAGQLTAALDISTTDHTSEHPWSDGTAVMGILNVTPDSFHDGGRYTAVDDAVARAERMVAAGAAIVDVGGESTRPGADPISVREECDRVVPVLERLDALDATVSIDTRKPAVARAALEAGADMVNDVTGLADSEMRHVVADHDVPAVLMHSVSAPVDPTRQHVYDDVVDDVLDQLTERVLLAERAGIDRSQLLIDPGLGFGKSTAESFALLDRLDEFHALGAPVMVGHSHKSMFRQVTGDDDDRRAPTVAATALAAERGVDVVRVHDVAPNVAAVATADRTIDER